MTSSCEFDWEPFVAHAHFSSHHFWTFLTTHYEHRIRSAGTITVYFPKFFSASIGSASSKGPHLPQKNKGTPIKGRIVKGSVYINITSDPEKGKLIVGKNFLTGFKGRETSKFITLQPSVRVNGSTARWFFPSSVISMPLGLLFTSYTSA